ncbi:MAG: hypothetical protein ACYTAF_03860 [Planctomycetota bacterium]
MHALCILSDHSKRFHDATELDFLLNVEKDVIIEARGKVAHILQGRKKEIEKVGIQFTRISPEALRLIKAVVEASPSQEE